MNYKYFTLNEFACSETGDNFIDTGFVGQLDELRERCNFPFTVTSGYRAPTHSVEKIKKTPGIHTTGLAADIAVANGVERRKIVEEAFLVGFTGIGVAKTFVHVDMRVTTPVMWTY